ncbi:MAG: HemK2/MTQ2 family protein methyltransferase [Candidatus Bathyarchaeia archaeon]|jgi:release factor glutamine methyltransferase
MPDIREILQAIGKPSGGVYAPSDDTFLMIDALSTMPLRGKEVLDLGTGSGMLGLFCAKMGARVTVADIEDSVLEKVRAAARRLNLVIEAVRSSIFSSVTARFDVVLFNPPYLPSDEIKDLAVDGGNEGRHLVDRFLEELSPHLKEDGCALLLVSSLNDPRAIIDSHRELSFSIAASRSLFFEELQVLLCKLRNLPS